LVSAMMTLVAFSDKKYAPAFPSKKPARAYPHNLSEVLVHILALSDCIICRIGGTIFMFTKKYAELFSFVSRKCFLSILLIT